MKTTLDFLNSVNFGHVGALPLELKERIRYARLRTASERQVIAGFAPWSKARSKMLTGKVVCDVSDRNCMLHCCEKCPGAANLKEYLQSVFTERSIDEEDELTFKQWTNTDGTRLITR